MKEEFILKVLHKTTEHFNVESVQIIRCILEEELYNYEMQAATRELVPVYGMPEKILLYLTAKKLNGLSPRTLQSYKEHLFRFARFVQKDVLTVDAMDVRRYLAAYSMSGKKNSTVATETSYLKSFYKWLEDEDYIQKSPMRKVQTMKVEKRLRKALTPEELELLRCSCKTVREKAIVEFFYSTGCRLDEVQKLNKDDIEWHSESLHVIGKGNKERIVYLNAKAKIHLWKYLNTRTDINEALFVGERQPHARLGRRAIQKTFNELGRRAGIPKKVYPHLMRHTTATNMYRNGATLPEVQEYLGHTSPETTLVYTQTDKEAVRLSHKKNVI